MRGGVCGGARVLQRGAGVLWLRCFPASRGACGLVVAVGALRMRGAHFRRRTLRGRWVWRHLRTLTPTPLPGGEGLELPGCVVRGWCMRVPLPTPDAACCLLFAACCCYLLLLLATCYLLLAVAACCCCLSLLLADAVLRWFLLRSCNGRRSHRVASCATAPAASPQRLPNRCLRSSSLSGLPASGLTLSFNAYARWVAGRAAMASCQRFT